jgi:hypothetical protein
LGFGWYDHCWWATESGLGGKVSLDTANKRLDIMCPNWRAFNMWSERDAAPIAWTAAPAGVYYAETRVTLANLNDPQVAGFVLYDGPDGANGIYTIGIYTWGQHRTACFERVGDPSQTVASPELPLADNSLCLRLGYTPGHGAFSAPEYEAWYKLPTATTWTRLTSFRYPGSLSRIGLFLKTGVRAEEHAYFDCFSLTRGPISPVVPPQPIVPAEGSVVKDCAVHSALADGHYDKVFISGVERAVGGIRLENVTVTDGKIAAVGGGVLAYQGPLAELLGDVFNIESGQEDSQGLRLTVTFQVPSLLGGSHAQLQFLVTPECVLQLLGAHIGIPGKIKKEAFTIEKAYLDILPEEGKFGGGGLFGVDAIGKTFGGWIDFRAGIGPVVDGHRTVDVTKLGAGAGSLAIPIGNTGAFLEYVGAIIENAEGLSDPDHWLHSNLKGQFEVVLGRPLEIAGQEVFAYKFEGEGVWSIHDGSYDFTGEGKLLGKIKTTGVQMHYAPPDDIRVAGDFDAGIYRGSLSLHQSGGSFTGTLHGDLSIPSEVPVIGGKSCGSVDATLDESTFRGSATIQLTPEIPSVCTPQADAHIPPCTDVWACWDTCQSCWEDWFGHDWCSPPYPCSCETRKVCGPLVHIPPICTPAIPATHASFSFSFDPGSGQISFGTPSVGVGLASASPDSARHGVFPNWSVLGSAEAGAIGAGRQLHGPLPVVTNTFSLGYPAPGIIFRTAYATNASVDQVSMTVRTPAGLVLDSSQGELPLGYPNHLGFSRFHPEAHEQVILLANPAVGDYQVAVAEDPALGAFTIEALVQNGAPTGRITSLLPGPAPGQYVVKWEDHDLESTNTVRIYLDPERHGHDGFQVGRLEATANVGQFIIETAGLNIAPGDYFVTLVIEDGHNPPVFCISDTMISVRPAGCPEPVSSVQYLSGDASFKLGWTASPTPGVIGYRVEWTARHEDPGTMEHKVWVPASGQARLITEVKGLANGVPVLVQVVAVDEGLRRSAPSPLIRLTPRGAGKRHAPMFASTPDPDATAGHPCAYLPLLEDMDGAEACVWSLVHGPTNMTVDASCGLVCWTPTAEQAGTHQVMLQVEEQSQGQSVGVRATQSYTLRVHVPGDLSGLEEHSYLFLSHPPHDTGEGALYRYQPLVHGPDQNLRYQLLASPEGMTVDAASGLVTWAVPQGARGAWVRLQAVAGGAHVLEQDYYLYVFSPDQLLPWLRLVPTVSRPGQELKLGLAGILGQSWTIQASTNLAQWSDLTNVVLTNRTMSVLVPVTPDVPARYFRGR